MQLCWGMRVTTIKGNKRRKQDKTTSNSTGRDGERYSAKKALLCFRTDD